MDRPYKQIDVEPEGDIYCVRLLERQLDENGLDEFSADIAHLFDKVGCRKLVMVLGPHDPLCLYSVFLAKLVNMQRRLTAAGGGMALAGISDNAQRIFQVAGLHKFFHFYPDRATAIEALK
jgi:anti-anti-sigma factor